MTEPSTERADRTPRVSFELGKPEAVPGRLNRNESRSHLKDFP